VTALPTSLRPSAWRSTRLSFSCGALTLAAHLATASLGCDDADPTPPVATGTAGSSPGVTPPEQPPYDELKCPDNLPGPTLVRLTTPKGVPYCMDRTEVKQIDFSAFVAVAEKDPALLHPAGEPAHCEKGYKLLPDAPERTDDTGTACPASQYDPERHGDFPQVCVSPCAARACCLWAGKDLCGSTTRKPLAVGDRRDPEASAWHNACTNGGKTEVTVPGGFESGACRLSVLPAPVDSTPACVGAIAPFDQLLGVGDGVQEWADVSEGVRFYSRGPYEVAGQPGVFDACTEIGGEGGGGPKDRTGFRCCLPLTDG
jgi:hypothetical protein